MCPPRLLPASCGSGSFHALLASSYKEYTGYYYHLNGNDHTPSYIQQGSSDKDGRSNVYGCSEIKIVSNCCYPNSCRTNCSHFVNVGRFKSIQTYRYISNDDSWALVYISICVLGYMFTHVLVNYYTSVLVNLCTCLNFAFMYLCQ